jgi:HlyD family secretion protein
VTQIAASTNKTGATTSSSTDVTNYEVHIRLDRSSYQDLINPSLPKTFIFRPGMNASADIKTRRKDNVISVPISAVAARVKGSDKNIDDQKKEKQKTTGATDDNNANTNALAGEDLEEVVFVIKNDNTVERRIVKTGIQDINNIEITDGLKEGEQVVTGPFNAVSKTLKSGDKINIVSKDKLFEK